MSELVKLRGLLAKATPGPWGVDSITTDGAHGRYSAFVVYSETGSIVDTTNSELQSIIADGESAYDEVGDSNAGLIVEAVNALPALLDRIEALEAALTTLADANVGGLELLLMAVKSGDPEREIVFRINDLISENRAAALLAAPKSEGG